MVHGVCGDFEWRIVALGEIVCVWCRMRSLKDKDQCKGKTMPTQTTPPTRAIILFAHGSSSATWREPFDAIAEQVRAQAHDARVELAFLEIMSPKVNEVVRDCAEQGIRHIRIVPLFFGVGKHIAEDLQDLVEAMRNEFAEIQIEIASAVGQSEYVQEAMARHAVGEF